MKAQKLFALASVSLATLTVACQQSSKHAEAETGYTPPPVAEAPAPAPAPAPEPQAAAYTTESEYNVPAVVQKDTNYALNAPATAGMLHSGETVYLHPGTSLESVANTNGWVAAKTSDGRLIYVRAADLRLKMK